MNAKKMLALLLVFMLLLSGCGKSSSSDDNNSNNSNGSTSDDTSSEPVEVDFAQSDADMFTNRDYETSYDESSSVLISLNGNSATSSSSKVKISGTTITITDEGTYIVSGTLDNGMIIVEAEETDKPQIVLNGVNINSKTSAPIYILEADKVFITLASGTTNTLSNGGTFTEIDDNNIDGTVFSKQDLTFNGNGSLTVSSPAGHGIVCKDDLVFTSGTYKVSSASHGLDANDSVRITNATLTIDAGKDGIHSENSDDTTLGFIYVSSGEIDIEAEGDGVSAEVFLQVVNGAFDIVAGGGSENGSNSSSNSWGMYMGGPFSSSSSSSSSSDSSTSIKGFKATGDMLFSNGTFTIDSADDAIHSNASIVINGGTFELASGDDGIHADEELTITAGNINITESYEGLEALDIKVTGGDIKLVASDDGLNAAGGTDSSGYGGTRGNDRFGGHGGMGGGMGGSSSSNGSINISGGNLYVNASGDGIDANGTLEISGGYTVVLGPTQGDTATLDYDVSGVITGGTFIGTGASNMAQSFSDSEQGVIAASVGTQQKGTTITVKDAKGNTVLSYEPELSFQVFIFSSSDLVKGETYTVSVGTTSGTLEAN